MTIQSAYNNWAEIYDSNQNKTRDLESIVKKKVLQDLQFNSCLEIGCGTGKNTNYLLQKSKTLVAVDFSENMLAKAKEKKELQDVKFIQADINKDWNFIQQQFDLITFSLVLEHIKNVEHIFKEANKALTNEGLIYIGELHPFKQYLGSKARFETENGVEFIDCYTHNFSEFYNLGLENNFSLIRVEEFFDEENPETVPRILSLLFKKNN